MKRIGLVFGILSLLLFVDGIYLLATHKNPNGDTGLLFGNQNYFLSAGSVVVISALLLLVAAVVMWLVGVRREDQERHSAGDPPKSGQAGPSGDPPKGEQAGPSGRTATRA